MKSKIKNQWAQIVAVFSAAACAVTATVAGVSGSFVPMSVYALEAGDELTLTKEANDDGEGYHYVLDLSDTTKDDIGKTIDIEFVAKSCKNQNLVGAIGYADPTDGYEWKQSDWKVKSTSAGEFTVQFEITEALVGHDGVQVQCWYPTVEDIDSYTVVFDKDGVKATTTSTEATTTTTTDATDVTTTTTVSGEESSSTSTTTTTVSNNTTTTTTATTTTEPDKGTEVKFTEGTQKGEDGDIQAVAEFKPGDAKYAVIKYKVLSDDLKSSGGIGTWNGDWVQVDFDEDVDADGIVTVTYQIPEDVGSTVKAMVFYPSNKDVRFQSITLYGTKPVTSSGSTVSTANTTVTTTTATTSISKNIAIGVDNKINVINKCYLVATMKTKANTDIGGAVYYDKLELKFNGTTGSDGILTAGFKIRRGLEECSFQIQSGPASTPVSFTSYYAGDASLNGRVNASDVRAIVKYIRGSETSEIKECVCDYNGDGKASMNDAVALTKALVGSGQIAGN
ncbi:MAG: dockerin type I repeat-containing protein [Ruminococcus sp.]|nr:dockerin type I repeat-containing protein [Ruminococcus sp.]